MKLRFMKRFPLFQISLIFLLNLPLCAIAKAAALTAQQAEANAVITSFAMDAFKCELPASEFAAWPIPLHDSLIYSLGSRPSGDWSLELRQFVLAQFERHITDLEDHSHPDGQFKAWLQLPDPLKDTTLAFLPLPAVGVETPSQHFATTWNIEDNSKEAQQLSQFLLSLSTAKKAELLAAHGRIPLSELTEQQTALVKQILHSERDFGIVNGAPIRPFQEDSVVLISIIFSAIIQDSQPDARPGDYYETVLARPLNPKQSPQL